MGSGCMFSAEASRSGAGEATAWGWKSSEAGVGRETAEQRFQAEHMVRMPSPGPHVRGSTVRHGVAARERHITNYRNN